MVVQKYGGTSVATTEKIMLVAKSITERLEKEKKMVVVVSAMSGETDKLTELGKSVGLGDRELDQLVCLGENKTISLLAGALKKCGVRAISLTGWQAGVITTDDHSKAKINQIKVKKILKHLDKNDVVVIAGFQGVTKEGDVTTLGKGGSDTTATALAGAFGCGAEIFTDVCGIFSADPKILPNAKKFKEIEFDMLMEMSACGAKVMETRSVEIAKRYEVNLAIGKSLENIQEGTKVVMESFEGANLNALTVKNGVSAVEISVKTQEELKEVLNKIQSFGQNLEMFDFENNESLKISFIVDEKNKKIIEELEGIKNINVLGDFAKITIVGSGFRTHKDVVSGVILTLKQAGVIVKKIMLSQISVEILIGKQDERRAIEILSKMFNLETKKINLAIVGATGLVGRTFLQILEENHIKHQIENLYLFASPKSAGKVLQFDGKALVVEELNSENVLSKQIDYAFFSAGENVSKNFANVFVDAGAVVIDNSSAFRMKKDVPLIVPEVNFVNTDAKIIANPNCSTIQCVLPLFALKKHFGLKEVNFSTYQAVSGSGEKGVQDYLCTAQGESPKFYPYRIYSNCLPQIGGFNENGYTSEEMKMVNETRKILSDEELEISATCVRVPVKNCHSVLVSATLKTSVSLEEIINALQGQVGIKVLDDVKNNLYPINDFANGQNEVLVGRIRKDLFKENVVHFWCVADNVRKGAALNGIQILERLLKK